MTTVDPVRIAFETLLPTRPYCSNDLDFGIRIRRRDIAVRRRYIQLNDPITVRWLVFDLDHEDAAEAWELADLPAPNFIAQNRDNPKAHLAWCLANPVFGPAANGRSKPLNFLSAIERGMRLRLRADAGYVGLICKNPLHSDYRVSWPAAFGYSLADLSERLEQREMRRPIDPRELGGLGRNCELFEKARVWAYGAVLDEKETNSTMRTWSLKVLRFIQQANQMFSMPLGLSELRAIAGSIARWTWRNFSDEAFSALQAERGRRSGEVRRCGSAAEAQPWAHHGISRATYYRRRRAII